MEKKKDKRENFNTKQVLIESKTQMEDFLTVQFHAKKFYIVNLSQYTITWMKQYLVKIKPLQVGQNLKTHFSPKRN